MRKIIIAQAFAALAAGFLVLTPTAGAAVHLEQLKLPAGFGISIYAQDVENARQMTRSDAGIIYVGSREAGKVHAVIDRDGDFRADEVKEIASGLRAPSGLTWRDGDLYVAAISTIYRYPDIDNRLDAPPEPEIVTDALPDKIHHGWKFIEFGPDGLLYVPVGAPCNICDPEPPFASILRMDVNKPGPEPEVYVRGVRNSVGFDWDPRTGDLWFTDNGRDNMGDDKPSCELNHVTAKGQHFGYPYFHGNGIPDPEFGEGMDRANYREPALALGPHVAPLGMIFYTGDMLPARFENTVILAEHGSWNRSPEAGHIGYRLIHARPDDAGELHYEILVDGWLQNNEGWGRPVDILELPDGSLLVSDDRADVIYRITYSGR